MTIERLLVGQLREQLAVLATTRWLSSSGLDIKGFHCRMTFWSICSCTIRQLHWADTLVSERLSSTQLAGSYFYSVRQRSIDG